MKVRVIRIMSVTYQPAAGCADCNWRHPMSANAREAAKGHAEVTGHEVIVERAQQDRYRREEQPGGGQP